MACDYEAQPFLSQVIENIAPASGEDCVDDQTTMGHCSMRMLEQNLKIRLTVLEQDERSTTFTQ